MASKKIGNEIKTRLTWLLIGLAMSMGIARIIQSFEHTLEANLVLASFIPLIVYMSDAVGTQMEAMIIRELNSTKKFVFRRFLAKQVPVVIGVSFIIGLVGGGFVMLTKHSTELGIVIGVSLIAGIWSSLITGSLMPYMFWRLHDDPAEASGPVATVVQDMLSVIIFFLIAQAML